MGCSLQQMIEDREVVDAEIGDDVYVALEQAEVHPAAVVVQDFSELAAGDDFAHLANGAGVNKGVIDEKDQVALVRFVQQLARLQ